MKTKGLTNVAVNDFIQDYFLFVDVKVGVAKMYFVREVLKKRRKKKCENLHSGGGVGVKSGVFHTKKKKKSSRQNVF